MGCRFGRWAAVLLLLVAQLAHADPLSAARLLHDAHVLVDIKTQRGWEIDRAEIDALLPSMLESFCRTDAVSRQQAQEFATERRQALGGPLAEQLAGVQGDIAAVAAVLRAERVMVLLARAATAADADCPPVLRAHTPFVGRQTLADRTVVHLDAGGLVTLRNSDRGLNYGGGGSGRVMVGRGFSTHWIGLAGLEIGGAALLDQGQQPQQDAQLKLHLYFAAPLVVRHSWSQWQLDLDAAPVLQLNSDVQVRGVGVRAGALVVVATARLLNTIPWAGLGISVEHMLGGEAGRLHEWTVRGGFRAGFDWDFGATRRDRVGWRVGR